MKTGTVPLTVLAISKQEQAFELPEALIVHQGESAHNFQDAVVVTRDDIFSGGSAGADVRLQF